MQYAADFLRWFAEEAKRVSGQILPAPRKEQRFMVLRQPVGVGRCGDAVELPDFDAHQKNGAGVGGGLYRGFETSRSNPAIRD